MNFGRTLKKALKHNNLPTDFVTWSAIARDRPRWWLLVHSTPTPSLRRPTSLLSTTTPLYMAPGPCPCLRSPGLARVSPKRNTPKSAPPTATPGALPVPTAPSLNLSSTISRKVLRSATEEEGSDRLSNYLPIFRTWMLVLRRQDLL